MKISVKEMTKVAICTALLCVSAMLAVPIPFTPIVITLQTLVLNIIALVLKPRDAFFSTLLYVIIGACGVSVFAGMTGGFPRLFSATGGFIIGFILAAPLISLLKGDKLWRFIVVTVFVGMPALYLFGTVHLCIVGGMDIKTALYAAVIPFIIGDAVKCVAASVLAFYINKALIKANLS